jgi:pSer/pThr/pTyr-binding forkhead associated (FHA) protein
LQITNRDELPSPEGMAELAASDPLPSGTQIVIRKESGPGDAISLATSSPTIMVGRADGVAEVVLDDEQASRYHACITHRGGAFFIADMGSANGTAVNGRLVSKAELFDGDRIQIGETVLSFSVVES